MITPRLSFFCCFTAISLLLSACKDDYSLGPAQYGSSSRLIFKDDRPATRSAAEKVLYNQSTESVLVGWEHFDENRQRIYNHIYRGAVKFNLNLLRNRPDRIVNRAILNYTIQAGAEVPTKDGQVLSCATKLYLATSNWQGMPTGSPSDTPDTIHGELFKSDLPMLPIGSQVSIDVTDLVKDWLADKKENYGFVFGATEEKEGLIPDNNQCWTILGDFTLKVHYLKRPH